MKMDIRDVAAVRAIRPMDVVSYLRQARWTEQERNETKAVWTMEDFEVLVPLSSTFSDYGIRMAEALQTLSVAENRSQLELFEDLTTVGFDVVRLRLMDATSDAGSVKLDDAAIMWPKSRDLMSAAACATKSPKPVFGPRRHEEVINYIRGVRMGQTEHGSYVIKLLSPVPPRLGQPQDTDEQLELENVPTPQKDEPFSRRVVLRLADALAATQRAAMTAAGSGSIAAFEDAVPVGVSANLCDAIVGFSSQTDQDRRLEVSISWALSRPLLQPKPTKVMFTPDTFPIIAEAGQQFRESAARDDFEVYGPIVKLERADATGEGLVTVHAFVEESPRKVTIRLDSDDYEKALDAHKGWKTIRCTGVLTKEGKSFKLRNHSGIEVDVDPDE